MSGNGEHLFPFDFSRFIPFSGAKLQVDLD